MADLKISQLTDGDPAQATDLLPVARAGATRRVTASTLAAVGTPAAHASRHEDGGADEIDVTGLSGLLDDPQTPLAHASSHQNGGGDEISVAGLSGELADPQPPKTHATSHQSGGSDAIKLDDFAAPDDNTDLNATTSAHGLLRKLDNNAAHFLDGQGNWSTPAGSGSYTDEEAQDAVGGILTDSGTVDFTYDDATPSITAVVKDDSITYAKLQNISATDRLLGRDTAGAGDTEEISVGGGVEFSGSTSIQRSALTGDVTANAGSNATTIANNAVTTAKIADANVTKAKIENVAASKLLGRGDSGAGAPQEITLGSGLAMSGTTVSATGGGPTFAYVASQQDITSAGFVDITGLTFSVAANDVVHVTAYIIYRTSVSGMGVILGVNGPASPTNISFLARKQTTINTAGSTTLTTDGAIIAYDTPVPNSVAEPNANVDVIYQQEGVFINGANSGTFAMRFSKENVAGTASIMPGSHIIYKKMN